MNHPNLCEYLIDDYGVCSKPADHLVHQPNGLSPREHRFQRTLKGRVEEMKLTKRNVKRIARVSGKTVEELELLRKANAKMGRPPVTVRYEVQDTPISIQGLRVDKVILDEAQQLKEN